MPGTDSREELGMLLTLSCCRLPAPHFLADYSRSAEIPWDLGSLCCFHLNMRRAVCRAQATRQQVGLSLTLSNPNYRGCWASASSCQGRSIYPQAGGTRPLRDTWPSTSETIYWCTLAIRLWWQG